MNEEHEITTGQIVVHLTPNEPVKIIKIQPLGSMISVSYIGVHSNISNTRVLTRDELSDLRVVTEEGKFNFKGDPERFKLFAEAERINSAYLFDPLFAVNCSIVDPLPHQIEAVYHHLLPLPKIRFLLADDTGAGKTIMTGLLLKELMMRGLVERILIVTPGGLTKQWQEDELGLKFNMPFKLVNRAAFVSDPNIFSSSNRLVTSIDFIRNEDVMNILENISWDMVIVDEAHKLSAFDYGKKRYRSKRYQAMEKLASKCEHLLLLTATPHRGRRDTFKNLLQLLDEDVFASDSLVTSRIQQIGKTGANKFFIRRLKEQMKDWDGAPLYKKRNTKTVMYELTSAEKELYDKVTNYLLSRKEEARAQSNIYVTLALMVMQRRLTSSIYAIKRTLKNRYDALNGLLEELNQNPGLWKQRQKLDIDCTELDDFYELDDSDREGLENIMSDPRKFKLFTTAKNTGEIAQERDQVKSLFILAETLYNQNQEEAKFIKLRGLLKDRGVLDKDEKLIIFTEHKDTLIYLEERLKNNGYKVGVIHGGQSVDVRRSVQVDFAQESQILIATDAAGEGINLQFCRLLINWDIPWNPNRLEQRMGRIHRYGQKRDVTVFNMVARNTREGQVLERLLVKLDLIREQLGDDRVYDVISDIFEDVDMADIVDATFNGAKNDYTDSIDNKLTQEEVKNRIYEQQKSLSCSTIDYRKARQLKEESDEKRLQPIYIRLFFEKAFKHLDGTYSKIRENIYRIEEMPESMTLALKNDYNFTYDIKQTLFCFEKEIFLDSQKQGILGTVNYINPGNPVFDTLVKVIRQTYREDMLKGTVLVSPDDPTPYLAYFMKSQIADQRHSTHQENIADEKIAMIIDKNENEYTATSPAKFIDLYAPSEFAKNIDTPDIVDQQNAVEWCFENITNPQLTDAKTRIEMDINQRKEFMEEAFRSIILDLSSEINELQAKSLLGDKKSADKITQKQASIQTLQTKKTIRMDQLEKMKRLSPKVPEILGCAYVVPLSQVEYKKHYGMSRDDECEKIAMETAMTYETDNGWTPYDVSSENAGYDIRSINHDDIKRYIEVKGRSATGGVMVSENEMNRLSQLGDSAWLYIVLNCKAKPEPELYRIQNPAKKLSFERKSKGVQYFLPPNEFIKN